MISFISFRNKNKIITSPNLTFHIIRTMFTDRLHGSKDRSSSRACSRAMCSVNNAIEIHQRSAINLFRLLKGGNHQFSFISEKERKGIDDNPVITYIRACKTTRIWTMEKELDISVNLSSFFLKSIGLWIGDGSTNERRRKGMLAYTIWCTFFSTIISSRDLYFTWIYNGVRAYCICMKLPAVTVSVYELVFI